MTDSLAKTIICVVLYGAGIGISAIILGAFLDWAWLRVAGAVLFGFAVLVSFAAATDQEVGR